jgi:hypothetical protein
MSVFEFPVKRRMKPANETELEYFPKADCPMCKGTGVVLETPGSFPGIAGVTVQCECLYTAYEEAKQRAIEKVSKGDAITIERLATAMKLANELLWFNGDWGFVLNAREHTFLENIEKSPRVLTQSEWEWLCDIELRYAKLRAAAGVDGASRPVADREPL